MVETTSNKAVIGDLDPDLDIKFWKTKFFNLKSVLELSLFSADELKAINKIVDKYDDEQPFAIESMFVLPQPIGTKIEVLDNDDTFVYGDVSLDKQSNNDHEPSHSNTDNLGLCEIRNSVPPFGLLDTQILLEEQSHALFSFNEIENEAVIEYSVVNETLVSGETSSQNQQKNKDSESFTVAFDSSKVELQLAATNNGLHSLGTKPQFQQPPNVLSPIVRNDNISGQIPFFENVSN